MGKKILFIDESAMLRRIAASVLGSRSARYEVLAATRAVEGFSRACSQSVNLILVDQKLLDLHGDDLTCRLLADLRTARVPVVMMIGRASPLPLLDSLSANVVEILRKPFAPEQLAATVAAILDAVDAGADLRKLRSQRQPPPAEPPFRAIVSEEAPDLDATYFPSTSHPPSNGAPSAFHTLSPRAALQRSVDEKFTGVLRFSLPEASPVEVLSEKGRIMAATTRDCTGYSEDAAQVLPFGVSAATLDAAVQDQCRHGIPFFLTLGARGHLSKAAAEALTDRFGQRCFSRLWTAWPPPPACEFEEMKTLPVYASRLQPRHESMDEWLLGTMATTICQPSANRLVSAGKSLF